MTWASYLVRTSSEWRECIETALLGLYACVDELLAERRRAPGDDSISALIEAEEAGDRLTPEELRAMVVGLVFAGNDTTRNQLGLGMYAFVDHPAQCEVGGGSGVTRACDPLLRPRSAPTVLWLAHDIAMLANQMRNILQILRPLIVLPPGAKTKK